MNPAQIHLALNHVPVILSITGGLILAASFILKNPAIIKTGLILLIISALAIIPVYLTGEGTEKLVEDLPSLNENIIDSHEDMAGIAFAIILASGIAAAISLLAIVKKISFARILLPLTMLLSLAGFGFTAQTAHLGGLIRHQEIQNGQINQTNSMNESKPDAEKGKNEEKEKESDKDDD